MPHALLLEGLNQRVHGMIGIHDQHLSVRARAARIQVFQHARGFRIVQFRQRAYHNQTAAQPVGQLASRAYQLIAPHLAGNAHGHGIFRHIIKH